MRKKIVKHSRAHSKKRHIHKGLFCSCRGKLQVKYLALGGVAILAVAAGGYFMFGKDSSSLTQGSIISKVTNPSGKLSEKDFAYLKDPILRKHYAAMANNKKQRSKSNMGGTNGGIIVSEMEMLGNYEDLNYNSSVWTEVNGKRTAEYMTIGDTMYVKDYKDNKWWKGASKKADDLTSDETKEALEKYDIKEPEEKSEPEAEPKKIGEEPCPNITSLTCYKYEENDKFMGQETKTTMWIDTKNYLLRKTLYENSWQEYEYDNIDIQAPSPTKDVPAGKEPAEYLMESWGKMTEETQNKSIPAESNPEDSTPQTYQLPPQAEEYIETYQDAPIEDYSGE